MAIALHPVPALPPLDKLGNNLTPPKGHRRHGRDQKDRKTGLPETSPSPYRRRRASAKLFPDEAVAGCGQHVLVNFVTKEESDVVIRVGEHSAGFSGVMTCGSVWLCAVCAGKIAGRRRAEVAAYCRCHAQAGGSVYMLTLTLPHGRRQTCRELREVVSKSWSKLINGEPFKRAKARAGWVGHVRALEVTHGRNGWHPHIHALFFVSDDSGAEAFGDWLFQRWIAAIERMGYGVPQRQALHWQQCVTPEDAGAYIAKGADWELTHGHLKASKGGRSQQQILDGFAADGNARDAALFREFGVAFKGARQLTWSKGLRELYGDQVETLTDADAAKARGRPVVVMDASDFQVIVDRHMEATVLTAAQQGGWYAVWLLLASYGRGSSVRAPP